jgi:hypothetical protein
MPKFPKDNLAICVFCGISAFATLTLMPMMASEDRSYWSTFFWSLFTGISIAWVLFEFGFIILFTVNLLVYGVPLEREERIEIIRGPHQGELAFVKNQSGQLIVAVIENDPIQHLVVLKRGDVRRAVKVVL